MLSFRAAETLEIEQIKGEAQILLVTATDVETQSLHAILKPIPPSRKCAKLIHGNQTYYIGRIGNYGVIHAQCQMGSVSAGSSLATVSEAIKAWDVNAVVMVGIAFGTDPKKQSIGDVLVSRSMCPYDSKRVGKTNTIQRSPNPPCGATLLNRFSDSKDWQFYPPKGGKAKMQLGDLLTGESLIDNPVFLRKLLKIYPNACGGEMEGAGVYSAAHTAGIQWILVKAICDFADGNKRRGKKQKQQIAAESAVSFCRHVFLQAQAFDALNCTDLTTSKLRRSRAKGASDLTEDEVLFDIYRPECSDAYIERVIDRALLTRLKRQGAWFTGPSGCGKTSALLRALHKNGKDYHFIDLSPCVGSSVCEIFRSIYLEIREKIGAQPTEVLDGDHSQPGYIKAIGKLLQLGARKEFYFVIDEIPISSDEDFRLFAQGIAGIIISLANKGMTHIRFALASIHDPIQKNSTRRRAGSL